MNGRPGPFLVVKKPVSYFAITLEFVNCKGKSLKIIPEFIEIYSLYRKRGRSILFQPLPGS